MPYWSTNAGQQPKSLSSGERMKYLDLPETMDEFVLGASDLLQDKGTHVYFDTSFLMWLTVIGPLSRKQFFDWSGTLAGRAHVPLWSMHEYYRHHTRRTLTGRLDRSARELAQAANAFVKAVRPYTDSALLAGQPEAAYRKAVDEAVAGLCDLANVATGWDYRASFDEVLEWMNDRPCDTATVFDALETLSAYGAARFTQDVPPGFLDRRKKDRPTKGSNRYGDLLFWEEVVHHAGKQNAAAVIIMTNDRKEDWFAPARDQEAGGHWQRLRNRWKPVPVPHPTLAFELKVKAKVTKLVLLDSLYLGAVLWQGGRPSFERLAWVALDVDPERMASFNGRPKPAAKRAAKRQSPSSIGIQDAERLIASALDQQPDAAVGGLLARLDSDAPNVEAFVNTFAPVQLSSLTLHQVTIFAKQLHDRGSLGVGPAQALATRLLDMLDDLDPDRAAAAYSGLVVSAYFEGRRPRARPSSHLLASMFDWQTDDALVRMLSSLGRSLKRAHSVALYIPNSKARRVKVRLEHDLEERRTPPVLRQLFIDGRAALERTMPAPARRLAPYPDGTGELAVHFIVQAACTFYGMPHQLTDISGGGAEELRSVSAALGFKEFDRFTADVTVEDDGLPSEGEVDERSDIGEHEVEPLDGEDAGFDEEED